MRCLCCLLVFGSMALCFGCAATSTRGVDHVSWQVAPDELGRVAVLFDLDEAGPETSRAEKETEIEGIIRSTFESMSASTIIDGRTLVEALGGVPWTHASDHELITAARDLGIDAIALVRIERYLGTLSIYLLPPGWSAHTQVSYRLRALDVASGRLLADLHRHRSTGGFLGYSERAYLARDFEDDLAHAVSLPPSSQ
jgi:hypothetical protein